MRKRTAETPQQPPIAPSSIDAGSSKPAPNGAAAAVKEVSQQLKDELDKEVRPIQFASAHKPAKEDPLDPRIERIVEAVFVDKPDEVFTQLERDLRIGEKRSDHGSVNKALDEAESNARLAHRLWMTAKVEETRWELENQQIFGVMYANAQRELQKEKEAGHRNKTITDKDVETAAAILYGDEWRHQEVKKKKVAAMVKSMENLSEMWNSRCRSLQAMLTKQR